MLTLFFTVLRAYLTNSLTNRMTTPDVEDLFRDWNTERQAKISSGDGGVGFKWCEDQLNKIINTR